MSSVQPAYNDRIRHTLEHVGYDRLQISEPEGWNEDEKEYHRHNKHDGIIPKFSNHLQYVGEARNFINTVRQTHGITAKMRDIKEVLDDDFRWTRAYDGFLDLMTWKDKDQKVSVKFNSGGLEQLRKAREKDKVEIERTDTISGVAIPELIPSKLNLPGRRIFLKTVFDVQSSSNTLKLDVATNDGNTRSAHGGIPLSLFSQSHDLANSVIPETTLDNPDENNGTTGVMFYALNDRTRNLDIKLDIALDAFFQQYENVQWCRYKIVLNVYENGIAYDLKQQIELSTLDSDLSATHPQGLPSDKDYAYPQFTKSMTATYDDRIVLLEGESLALECYLKSDMYPDNNAGVRVYAQNITGNLYMDEDSQAPASTTDALLAYEFFDRLVTIITGSTGNFKSTFLGRKELGYNEDGPGAYCMLAHGHWIRGFTKTEELYKPFTTSFSDAIESFETAYNVRIGIEKSGNKEFIVLEKKDYFYNRNVTARLGKLVNGKFEYTQVQNVERSTAKEFYFKSIEIGSEKGGVYDEIMGLEETNTKSNFTTPIDVDGAKDFVMLAKYRFDPYGAEIIRRRSILTHPTTDHSFDLDIWMFDAKPSPSGVYELKTWQDVLATEPVGMFSPETSFNFLYSPVNLLLEHGWFISSGLTKNQSDYIKFGSSTGKSKVTMQKIGRDAYAENGDIPISKLDKAIFIPEEIKFEWQTDVTFLNQLEGKTNVLGEDIKTLYGTFEFLNEENQLEKAIFIGLKPNGKGDWTVLKENR